MSVKETLKQLESEKTKVLMAELYGAPAPDPAAQRRLLSFFCIVSEKPGPVNLSEVTVYN